METKKRSISNVPSEDRCQLEQQNSMRSLEFVVGFVCGLLVCAIMIMLCIN